MIIEGSNLSINKSNTNQTQITNNNDLVKNIIENKQTNQNKDMERIKMLSSRLAASQRAQEDMQDAMSYLQKKEQDALKIKEIGEQLKSLSKEYNNAQLSDEEKTAIKNRANELLESLDEILNGKMTGDIGNMSEKKINIDLSEGGKLNLTSDRLKINLDTLKLGIYGTDKEDKNFLNNISIDELLKNPSIIDEEILKPTEEALDEVLSDKSSIYNTFLNENSMADFLIDELYAAGGISGYMKGVLKEFQSRMYESISGIRFQSNNLDRNNVLGLLR